MPKKPHVLIAGAGIGGLTAALALLKKGFDVDVYEQADALREVGAGIQVSANGSRVLYALGLQESLEQVVCRIVGKEIRIWNTDHRWKLFDLGASSVERYGAPYFMIHRADLHQILAEAVRREKPDAIHLSAPCSGFQQSKGRVTLLLDDGRRVEGGALIGADGIHSKIRRQMLGADETRFMGIVAWRCLVPMERLSEPLTSLVGTNRVGPRGHIVHYPVRRGELLNFAGFVERSDWHIESWNVQGSAEECAADFQGWHHEIHEIIRKADTLFKWALLGRDPLPRWTEGRVTLLGDACHPMLPFLAQGANMAIEDGYVLARCLESLEVETALARYQAIRHERTSRAVRGSEENAKRFHASWLSDPVQAAKYVDHEWQKDRVKARYDWLFEYDATTVAID